MVTSIPIPRFENVKIKPINFAKCAQSLDNVDVKGHGKTGRYSGILEWLKNGVHRPFIIWSTCSNKRSIILIKFMNFCVKIYTPALPELKLMSGPLRKRRGIVALILSAIPGLITLAVESVSSWIKGKQQKRVDEAVSAMRVESQVDCNKLRQYSNDFLMYGKYNVNMLQNVIDTVNAMHR